MDVIAFCVVLIVLAAFVARPLYGHSEPTAAAEPTDELSAERALGELEIDRVSGLLDDAGYEQERGVLEARRDRTD